MIAECDGSRCEWCDTDVATYRTVLAGCDGKQVLPVVRGVTGVTGLTLTWFRTVRDLQGVMVRGVTGVTLTWLRTVLWLQGVMESRYYPWYAV